MIDPRLFLGSLQKSNINFITGVPDSLLKEICACISHDLDEKQHIIATNEGSAIGLAIGNYLSTKSVPLVYLQNSGLGNIINPITSLADPKVYGIPIILLIGWRGELDCSDKQLRDEPQHIKQGKITLKQLDVLDIPYTIIDGNITNTDEIVEKSIFIAEERQGPYALVVKKGTFDKFKKINHMNDVTHPTREDVIKEIISNVPSNSPIVSTTGVSSRELYELREHNKMNHENDFLTVGGMGHANQIAAGIAFSNPSRKVFCLDGDGAALMHLGALAISSDCNNLIHILINNGVHDSVGGQPTKGNFLNFSQIALELGYGFSYRIGKIKDINCIINKSIIHSKSVFIEIICRPGFRKELGRPTSTPQQNKIQFMEFLS